MHGVLCTIGRKVYSTSHPEYGQGTIVSKSKRIREVSGREYVAWCVNWTNMGFSKFHSPKDLRLMPVGAPAKSLFRGRQ
jgi:hypothetical protein